MGSKKCNNMAVIEPAPSSTLTDRLVAAEQDLTNNVIPKMFRIGEILFMDKPNEKTIEVEPAKCMTETALHILILTEEISAYLDSILSRL